MSIVLGAIHLNRAHNCPQQLDRLFHSFWYVNSNLQATMEDLGRVAHLKHHSAMLKAALLTAGSPEASPAPC